MQKPKSWLNYIISLHISIWRSVISLDIFIWKTFFGYFHLKVNGSFTYFHLEELERIRFLYIFPFEKVQVSSHIFIWKSMISLDISIWKSMTTYWIYFVRMSLWDRRALGDLEGKRDQPGKERRDTKLFHIILFVTINIPIVIKNTIISIHHHI